MKKLNNYIFILLVVCLPKVVFSQVLTPPEFKPNPDTIIDGAYDKIHNETKPKAYKYPSIKEKDIVWSRTIWREIDLRQKINHHFYFPAIENRGNLNVEKMSLIDVIMEAIQHGDNDKFRCFNVVNNMAPGNEFKYGVKTQEEEALIGTKIQKGEAMSAEWGGDSVVDGNTVYFDDIITPFNRTEVRKWHLKEEWYFDKHRSTMDVRIVGLCPIRTYIDENEEEKDEPLFWIYFPEYRDLLVQTKVANFTKNNAQQRSYLGIFEKRMFASRILQESNIMNRAVTDYMIGLDALLESNRIKEEIFNIEQDMWEY